jgi:prepilin-type N-terminal cleavage/methylation domain-containing protein
MTERGFTLLEVMVSSVILVPILLAILATRDVVGITMNTNERRADVGDHLRRVARRVRKIARPGLISSARVKANQGDIDEAEAAELIRQTENPLDPPIYIPTLGEWIAPKEDDPRPNIQFVAADGRLALNASATTTSRSLEFELDPGEVDNDKDDDGDGLVDEGKLYFRYETSSYVLLDNVEACTFAMRQGMLMLFVQVARHDARGRIHRASTQQRILMRNN